MSGVIAQIAATLLPYAPPPYTGMTREDWAIWKAKELLRKVDEQDPA